MTNDEIRMTKEVRSPNDEATGTAPHHSGSKFRHSFVIRDSTFGFLRASVSLWFITFFSCLIL